MSAIKVRPFHRSDREQLTGLVNAHAGAVLPGLSASASTVLSALERQPGEFIEDPCVGERLTLVAWQGDRIAAAAHLLRYFPDERAGGAVRDAGEIHWLVFWPEAPAGNPHWPDATEAAESPIADLCARRSAGMNGTRLSAMLGQDTIGFIEVEIFDDQERRSRHGSWADIGNLQAAEAYRRQGVATWLLGQAADWRDLAGVGRLLDYAWLQGTDAGGLDHAGYRAFLAAAGFREITRTRRGWRRATTGTGHRQPSPGTS
jgi:GNAT superfamily N-acetyltransferase